MKKPFLSFLLFFLPLLAYAEIVWIDGFRYDINTIDNFAELKSSGNKKGVVTIPSKVVYEGNSYPVTKIGVQAFLECSDLTSVIIPNSVTYIGNAAFKECINLTFVTIPYSVTEIGPDAFSRCYSLTTIFIPSSVTKIGAFAFEFCSGLTSITIPNSVKVIEPMAFQNCSGLTSVTISNNVTSIGYYTFGGCNSLTSITIPSGVTSIGKYAFSDCKSLTDFYCLAENVPTTDSESFNYTPMEEITLHVPAGSVDAYSEVEPWKYFKKIVAFDNQAIHVATAGTLPNLISKEEKYLIKELTLTGELNGTDIRFIRDMAGVDMEQQTNEFDYSNIATNGRLKFLDLSNVKIVEGGTHYYMELLSSGSEVWPNFTYTSNDVISERMFWDCHALEELILPSSITIIKSPLFYAHANYLNGSPSEKNKMNIKTVKIAEGNSKYDSRDNCNAIIETESNKLIAGGLNSAIPCSVTSIGDGAFQGCSGLTTITIPNSIVSIGDLAFSYCTGLTDFYCEAEIIPTTEINSFAGSNIETITLHVPAGSVDAYDALEPWKNFKEIVAFGPQCAKPEIIYSNNKIKFACETEGVTYQYTITNDDVKSGNAEEVNLGMTYLISVYATKKGFLNSDVTTREISIVSGGQTIVVGDVDGNGVVNVADHVKLSEIIMNK